MGILSNYKINELRDEELQKDLDRNDLLPDLKALVVSELTRRRIKN
jgi:hypothetical protein